MEEHAKRGLDFWMKLTTRRNVIYLLKIIIVIGRVINNLVYKCIPYSLVDIIYKLASL